MSCETPIVEVTYGETIDLVFNYTNEDGSPMDLTDATVEVDSASPAIIKTAAEVTITDAPGGVVRFLLHRDDALSLRRGLNNRFRILTVFGSESDDVTPDIYLQVT